VVAPPSSSSSTRDPPSRSAYDAKSKTETVIDAGTRECGSAGP
jgi:hypothetical protein